MTDLKLDPPECDGATIPPLREYIKLRYMAECKCGDCQLVPTHVLWHYINVMEAAEAIGPPTFRSLVIFAKVYWRYWREKRRSAPAGAFR